MLSTVQIFTRVEGLIGTTDITEWEDRFLENLQDRYMRTATLSDLSEAQLEILQQIHDKHFA